MQTYLLALYAILAVGFVAWLFSIAKRDVSFVDSLWSLFFVIAAFVFADAAASLSQRGLLVTALVVIWGIVFGLQGVLAWLVALPLLPAIASTTDLGALDVVALCVWLLGFVFEAGGDYQLSKFKKDPANQGRVMDRGLWRLTRHPNYFGDFCVWWAFYLFALASGAWWSIVSPLLMSLLLLKVSGVAMLEKTIKERRPEYAEYLRTTNAFFPGPRRIDHET
jgi:steroid 5-alpha reductase family enzyme